MLYIFKFKRNDLRKAKNKEGKLGHWEKKGHWETNWPYEDNCKQQSLSNL